MADAQLNINKNHNGLFLNLLQKYWLFSLSSRYSVKSGLKQIHVSDSGVCVFIAFTFQKAVPDCGGPGMGPSHVIVIRQ